VPLPARTRYGVRYTSGVGFDLFVGDGTQPYRVTYNLYQLVSHVLHREFDFPQLVRMFTRAAAAFDPAELLGEAEVLKDMARGHVRPYVDVGRPLEGVELDGLVHFPRLLKPEGQIVTDWSEFVTLADGKMGLISTPPTLVAGRGKLHLVDAVAVAVADAPAWDKLERITADVFRWEAGQLLADGVPVMDVPKEFRRPGGDWTEVRFARITVYEGWRDEIEDLIDACREGIRVRKPIRTRSD
jgi:hypothetical protein